MLRPHLFPSVSLALLASCAAPTAARTLDLVEHTPPPRPALAEPAPAPAQQDMRLHGQVPPPRTGGPDWRVQQPLMHGFFGVTFTDEVSVDTSGPGHIDGDRGDLDELPLLGGGAQWKLGGERIDWGLEGLLSFSWRSDGTAFIVGGGGAAVAVDVSLMIFELYGGPVASVFLGDKMRLYGAAGPLMQWANYHQSGGLDDGSGFGTGLYARTGLEFALQSRTFLGFGLRWSDSSVDLGGSLGDLEIDGLQAVITVSNGI